MNNKRFNSVMYYSEITGGHGYMVGRDTALRAMELKRDLHYTAGAMKGHITRSYKRKLRELKNKKVTHVTN